MEKLTGRYFPDLPVLGGLGLLTTVSLSLIEQLTRPRPDPDREPDLDSDPDRDPDSDPDRDGASSWVRGDRPGICWRQVAGGDARRRRRGFWHG